MGILLTLCVFLVASAYSSAQGFALLLMARKPRRHRRVDRPGAAQLPVSVLVPCFNEEKVLHRTLETVLASAGVAISRVICIDDGSTDRTAEVVRSARHRHGDKVVLCQQANMGKAAALNHGLRSVSTEFFVSIDADTQVMPGTIAHLLTNFEDDRVAAVSGHMLVGNRSPASRAVYAAQAREYERANNIERRAFSRVNCITIVPGAVGAFRTAAVASVGGYSGSTLAEDAHLTFMLLMKGHRVVHEPRATVFTEAPDTMSALRKQRVRWATGKMQVVLRTSRDALRARGYVTLVWLHTAINQVVLPVLALLSTVVMPACLAILVTRAVAPPLRDYEAGVVCALVLVMLSQLACSWLSLRWARAVDAATREAALLPSARLTMRSALVLPATRLVATWCAWRTIATGKRPVWHKLDRTGDVRIPAPEPAARPPYCPPPRQPYRLGAAATIERVP